MEVLILSKTYLGLNNVFVGGMVLENKQFIRLLNPDGWHPYWDTEYQIGQVWDIDFRKVENLQKPHNEDVIVESQSPTPIRSIDNLSQFILQSDVHIWRGSIDHLFDSRLLWAEAGAGYISDFQHNIPAHSEGFWINDKPLNYEQDGHYLYLSVHSRGSKRKLKYKGLAPPRASIPAHTLLRVSLAKWWKPDGSVDEKRCYLLLSGWY
jgi:ATP-dependent DNA helicase RecQ